MKLSVLNKLFISIFFFVIIPVFFVKIVNPAYATPRSECTKDYGPVNCAFVLVATGVPPNGEDDGYCIEGCKGDWTEGDCPVGVPCIQRDASCKCGNGGVTCHQLQPTNTPTPTPTITPTLTPGPTLTPTQTPTPTPTGVPACVSLTSNNNSPSLGETIGLTCNKNADYTGAVTYNFRLIHKNSAADTDPSPLPTPFVQNSTNEDETYEFPTGQYGYYVFQCQVCAGAFCTDWQTPPAPTLTPTPTMTPTTTPTADPSQTPTPTPTLANCPAPNLNCGGICSDGNDTQNCGACGNVCSTGQLCVAGACYTPPASPTPICGPNQTPNGNQCQCLSGFGDCDSLNTNGCEADLNNGPYFCGACGTTCSSGQTCVSGVCQ